MKYISLWFLLLTASILVSCNSNKESQKRLITVKKNNVSETIVDKTQSVNEISCEFNYPKTELFLGFWSGMTRLEFSNHADSLIREGYLSQKLNGGRYFNNSINLFVPTKDYFYTIEQSNGKVLEIKLDAEFLNPKLLAEKKTIEQHIEVEEQEIASISSAPFEVNAIFLPRKKKVRVDFVMNQDGNNFSPPDFIGFKVVGGPSQSISNLWINGKRSFSKTYSFFLEPLREGTITIGPAAIEIEGEIYKSPLLNIMINEKIKRSIGKSSINSNICESLVAIKLIGAEELSDKYSTKYSLSKWPKTGIIEQSKIGRYNKAYNPKSYAKVKVQKEMHGVQFKTQENIVPMPQSFIDRAKKLDMFEEKVYYDFKVDEDRYEQTIDLGNDLIIYFKQNFKRFERKAFSLNDIEINPNRGDAIERMSFIVDNISENGIGLDESQSKQEITTIDFYSRIDVIYTTKKYYEEKYVLPEEKMNNDMPKS